MVIQHIMLVFETWWLSCWIGHRRQPCRPTLNLSALWLEDSGNKSLDKRYKSSYRSASSCSGKGLKVCRTKFSICSGADDKQMYATNTLMQDFREHFCTSALLLPSYCSFKVLAAEPTSRWPFSQVWIFQFHQGLDAVNCDLDLKQTTVTTFEQDSEHRKKNKQAKSKCPNPLWSLYEEGLTWVIRHHKSCSHCAGK